MPNAKRPNRQSHRLRGFNYKRCTPYFITICTQHRKPLFGYLANSEMHLNAAGRMVQRVWEEMPAFYARVITSTFQAMPDHIHGIVYLLNNDDFQDYLDNRQHGIPDNSRPIDIDIRQRASCLASLNQSSGRNQRRGQPQGAAPTRYFSLSDLMNRYKSLTTHQYMQGVKSNRWPRFDRRLWQRNYWDHIIRNDWTLNAIRNYIICNPQRSSDRDKSIR
jgi:putative transposase